MRLNDILNESMSFWIPDAERKRVEKECPACDGKGFIAFETDDEYHSETDIDKLRDKLTNEDRETASANRQLEFIKNTLEYNPQADEKFKAKLQSKAKELNAIVKQRASAISDHIKWIVQSDREECWECNGTGVVDAPDVDYDPMNLSNRNAGVVMSALGFQSDDYYTIKASDIPIIKRRIMRYMNDGGELDQHTIKGSVTQRDRGMVKSTDADGVTSISRSMGPKMYDGGVDRDYLERTFKRLLPILDHAQRNKMDVAVG